MGAMSELGADVLPNRIDKVLVLIPSLNDGAALPALVRSLRAQGAGLQPLIVDDGSAYPVVPPELAEQCLHVRLPANFGLGMCTHIAFSHAIRHRYDAVVRVDSDGQHDVRDIHRFVDVLRGGGADVVIGARANQDRSRTLNNLARRTMKMYFTTLAAVLTHGKLPRDVNSGFFAANARAIASLNYSTFERFPEPEMFIVAVRSGLRVAAVDIEQLPRRDGASTLGVLAAVQLSLRFTVFAIGQLLRRRTPPTRREESRWRT